MSRLPTSNAREMERTLLALGSAAVRRRASHVFYRHPDGRTTTVPHHQGRDLAKPLLREILREIGVSPVEFTELLKAL